MFFALSKIFWLLCSPLTFIGLLILGGSILILARRERWGRRILAAGCGLFLVCGFLPVGSNLMVALENKYVKPSPLPDKVKGIIVLGGMSDGTLTASHDEVNLNDNAERLTAMIELSRHYPQAQVIFTSGPGFAEESSYKESRNIEKLLKQIGISTSRFIFEEQARNTFENMTYSREIAHPQPGDTWLLVTSAFHMPRSVAIFTAGDWAVIPYPAGYIEEGEYRIKPSLDLLGNFYKLHVATREIVGIIAYHLTGKL